MSSPVIRTIGQADINEEIVFATKDRLLVGDVVDLKVTKPITAPVYGRAQVTRYNGPGRSQDQRRYVARRIN